MDAKTSKFIGLSTWKDADGLQSVSKTLTSAQILALNSTPITVITAPRANEVIEIISAFAQLNYGTVAYATNTGLDLSYSGNPTTRIWNNTAILGDASDIMRRLDKSSGASAQIMREGEAIVANNITGNPTDGDGTVTVYVAYRVVAI